MSGERGHWDAVYAAKGSHGVSWHEDRPRVSEELIAAATSHRDAAIDVGGGASRMPEALLAMGFEDIACLDLSVEAQAISQERLGGDARRIRWIVADVTAWEPDRDYDVWHDRAAFHFLLEPERQQRYAAVLERALRPGGVAVIGTFAPDGPERCSGLPVARHDSASIAAILGARFVLLSERRHAHRTPSGTVQMFQFSSFRRID